MKIYVDFDDILCETAAAFTVMAHEMFGTNVPYEEVHFFDLQKSFGLTAEQYEAMMIRGHLPEVLISYEETPGASKMLRNWIDRGHEVFIMTGRPASAYEPSRKWLDNHGLSDVALFCVNKYGRDSFIKGSSFSLELPDFYSMHFDFAVEDSPSAFKHLANWPDLRVAVYDRPWNKEAEFPNENYVRCLNWETIDDFLKKIEA